MNAKTSVFVVCVEVIIYLLLLYDLHDFTFTQTYSLQLSLFEYAWPFGGHMC